MNLNRLPKSKTVTRDRILGVAETLFATKGINGVTTRVLAETAGVNMAAVNYHFGNKDNLTIEVFRDVARRTAKRRLDSLHAIERAAKEQGRNPELEEIIEAFVDAYVNEDDSRSGILLAHLVLKHRVNPTEWTRAVVRDELDDLALRYVGALQLAAPHLSEKAVHWRYHLMVGAILVTLSDDGPQSRMDRLSGGLCSPSDRLEFRRELVSFLTSSFSSGPSKRR
ncbi:MAG: TetR/AcrR family transcriptional regulator [Marinosulfonomonas sp.]|nr:TetR/AcrR family transcriptional regulator [Marinosulfonomonas sp.]